MAINKYLPAKKGQNLIVHKIKHPNPTTCTMRINGRNYNFNSDGILKEVIDISQKTEYIIYCNGEIIDRGFYVPSKYYTNVTYYAPIEFRTITTYLHKIKYYDKKILDLVAGVTSKINIKNISKKIIEAATKISSDLSTKVLSKKIIEAATKISSDLSTKVWGKKIVDMLVSLKTEHKINVRKKVIAESSIEISTGLECNVPMVNLLSITTGTPKVYKIAIYNFSNIDTLYIEYDTLENATITYNVTTTKNDLTFKWVDDILVIEDTLSRNPTNIKVNAVLNNTNILIKQIGV